MNGIWQTIDLYCERTGPEYWSEPVNAITNLAFIAAGIWGLVRIRQAAAGRWAEMMAWWVIAIGVGSWLFHTHANRLTMWADILPIAGFTVVYILYNLRRFIGYGWRRSLLLFAGFAIVVGAITAALPQSLHTATNGSLAYLPPITALVFFGWLDLRTGSRAGWYNIACAAIFAVSLFFRSVDRSICEAFPLGTHFLWHTLNGLMLGVILLAIARFTPKSAARP